MPIRTSLPGRIRNTSLPAYRPLLPLYEAVVNAIQAVDENHNDMDNARIEIKVVRHPQDSLSFPEDQQLSAIAEPISEFIIKDNGAGFNDANMASFEELDSEYKSSLGCRGIGRILWLKTFRKVEVTSIYRDPDGVMMSRRFAFTKDAGVSPPEVTESNVSETGSEVRLLSFFEVWRQRASKTVRPIAKDILEHCLWYFVRPGGAPHISISDDWEHVDLDAMFKDYMLAESVRETITVKSREFDLIHLRLKTSGKSDPQLYWCAGSRVVVAENITKIPGLHGKLKHGDESFIYACYLSSTYLDGAVRPERIGFDVPELDDGFSGGDDPSMSEIREAAQKAAEHYLGPSLKDMRDAGRERVERFVNTSGPRYRPILRHMDDASLSVDPAIADKDLENLLHKYLVEFEADLHAEGQRILDPNGIDDQEYRDKLGAYLTRVEDVKKSDLAAYVSRRRVILDLLDKAIRSNSKGGYVKEEIIHNLIFPMRNTSNDVPESASNLWIIDERLAFHNFLASDKTLKSMPITGSESPTAPDLLALRLHYRPILAAERDHPPLASIDIVEIKRPMRNDISAGDGEKDPLRQVLRYLKRVRDGAVTTASGVPIPESARIPGYCYVIADLTPTMHESCILAGLRRTEDGLGYFGYNDPLKAYLEVISFVRLRNLAHQRNRAFFDQLGLPTGS